jgi:hypothetical protein
LLTYCKFAEYRCGVDSENNTDGYLLDCELVKKQCEEFTQKEF